MKVHAGNEWITVMWMKSRDEVKNEDVKWKNVRRTSEVINRKEKDDAWKIRKYKKIKKKKRDDKF